MRHPERKRWKLWLDAQLKWVEIGRAHPLLVCNPQDMLVPWIGDVAAAPILADMAMSVVGLGQYFTLEVQSYLDLAIMFVPCPFETEPRVETFRTVLTAAEAGQ